MMCHTRIRVTATALLTLAVGHTTLADPISASEPFHFRDFRNGASSARIPDGDYLTFGARNVLPNGDDDGDGVADDPGPTGTPTSGLASQGFIADLPLGFYPGPMRPNRFIRGVPYDSGLTGVWTLTFFNGPDSTTIDTPAPGAVDALPLVANFSLDNPGTTPTFNWTVPAGSSHDTVSIQIFDLEDFTAAGPARQVLVQGQLDRTTTEFAVPAGVLQADRRYSVAIQLDQFDGMVSFPNLVSRSRSFHDFSTDPAATGGVFLPAVDPTGGPTGGPVYHFNVDVQQGERVFIDPDIAIGYDYAVGAGDPNFASVILPDVGDGEFALLLFEDAVNDYVFEATLSAGVEFLFDTVVDRFRILGIEGSAGLDPLDTTAFVTGLTFRGDGTFTGTMTPITTLEVGIDIKPGDDANSFTRGAAGLIPVAIFSSPYFDATTVDENSLFIAGPRVKLAGKTHSSLCHEKDVGSATGGDPDGLPDLECRFITAKLLTDAGEGPVELTGQTVDGTPILGVDPIQIVAHN